MTKKILTSVASITAALAPLAAYAQQTTFIVTRPGSNPQPKTLEDLISYVIYYLNLTLDLMMVLAVVMFVWYVIKYFVKPNEDRKDAGLYVMYSIIGFFVILSLWGIVNILGNTFGLSNGDYASSHTWSAFTNLFPQ